MDEKAKEVLREAIQLIGIGEGLKASEMIMQLLNKSTTCVD